MFLWTNTKLSRTQTSLDSLNCMYNKKAHLLNIYYSLNTINILKLKRVVLKQCTNWYTLKKVQTWSVHHVLKQPKQTQLTRVNSIEKFLKGKVIWYNINCPFWLNITCFIITILNPYIRNLSIKTIVYLNVGANEITCKEKPMNNKTLPTFTVSERNLRRAIQNSSKHFISHAPQ